MRPALWLKQIKPLSDFCQGFSNLAFHIRNIAGKDIDRDVGIGLIFRTDNLASEFSIKAIGRRIMEIVYDNMLCA